MIWFARRMFGGPVTDKNKRRLATLLHSIASRSCRQITLRTQVLPLLPIKSNTLSDTNDFDGRPKEILVDGLKGLGNFAGVKNLGL